MNPNPQYAVLLKGKWGCGKTHFINHWIDAYQTQDAVDKTIVPVYVSLYGLSETKQITTAINRVLYPILYCKAAKAGKTFLKFMSAIVLKCDVDWDKDGNSDFSMNLGLDSLSIFKSEDEQVKKGNLLIFDDLERCDVPMKKLLGYLNFFVEQCNCHLIVIGDEDKIADGENKKIFGEFKEKTIGREFEIATDIHSALDTFVNQTPKNDFVVGHQKQIEKFFAMTECNNLRILRQALWDFSRFEESMTDFLEDRRYEDIMIHVLGSYIISYCEYRGKNHKLTDLANKIVRTDKDNNQRTITKATMSSRINGNPSLSNLYEIADALGVKITELFPEEDQWQECDKTQKAPSEFKIQTVCPSCGAKISASIKAE